MEADDNFQLHLSVFCSSRSHIPLKWQELLLEGRIMANSMGSSLDLSYGFGIVYAANFPCSDIAMIIPSNSSCHLSVIRDLSIQKLLNAAENYLGIPERPSFILYLSQRPLTKEEKVGYCYVRRK